MRTPSRKRRGFSLLELLAVVTIMGVIAAVVIPRISSSKRSAQEKVNQQNIAEINTAIERWYFEEGDWPNDLEGIGADADYFPEGLPVNPLTEKPYVLDTSTHRVKQ